MVAYNHQRAKSGLLVPTQKVWARRDAADVTEADKHASKHTHTHTVQNRSCVSFAAREIC